MNSRFINERITELRLKKGVSEYKMSLDLGHSRGYVQSISSGRALPSLSEFLYICEYLDVTPAEFFCVSAPEPILLEELSALCATLEPEDLRALIRLAEHLKKLRTKEGAR